MNSLYFSVSLENLCNLLNRHDLNLNKIFYILYYSKNVTSYDDSVNNESEFV